MGCQDVSGAGEDRSKQVAELRERILQLDGHDCPEEEGKFQTKLQEDLIMCKRDTLIELCHSFNMAGSRANRKEELVSFLMKFLRGDCSRVHEPIPVKHNLQVTDLREQILQLSELTCHEQEMEVLENLNVCKRDMLIELCRSFDIIGSRANRKEELVSFLMKFVKDHSSRTDGTNHDKKIKKRKHMKEEENLSSGKPLKKKRREGTALGTQDEKETIDWKAVEDRTNYSECDQKGNRYLCANSKNSKFPNEEINLEPTLRIDGFLLENVDAVTQNKVQVRTNEQPVTTSSSAKVAEVDSTNVKVSKKKVSSVTKKKATPMKDYKVKSCGKKGSKGDVNPRKLAMKPSRDELREAIVVILDATDFATMTFGDVVKEVDKYFGKDLFERKPLIRSLIEEELFRLSEEAEKKELEEEEAAEAKARIQQADNGMAQVRAIETGTDKRNKHKTGQNCKIKDDAKNANGSGNEKDVKGVSSVNRNSSDADEGSQIVKVNADTKIADNESTKDGKCEKTSPNVNNDFGVQGYINGEVSTSNVKNNNVDTLEVSKDGRPKEACNGENEDTKYDRTEGSRSENGGNNAKGINGCETEESRIRGDDERVKRAGGDRAHEAGNESHSNVAIHGDNDGKGKEGNLDAEKGPTDHGGDGKAEDADHNASTKVDVDSGKNEAVDNGKICDDVKADSNGIANEMQT
ncbi:hypothetical protein EJB05_06120, partial [Eragrostis curvula]